MIASLSASAGSETPAEFLHVGHRVIIRMLRVRHIKGAVFPQYSPPKVELDYLLQEWGCCSVIDLNRFGKAGEYRTHEPEEPEDIEAAL